MHDPSTVSPETGLDSSERLAYARVLVELGELHRAENEIAEVLERSPDHLEALSLLSEVKHMRGELSLAVACAAQVHARQRAPGETAHMHLESMLRLAHDPERGAGEFLAVGQFQLVQKPSAYLALEEAFRNYVARRPNEARAVCRQVAARYREKDPEVHKLAVLAEAWISELIGDLDAACEILERLGSERGYGTDPDRLMALVGLYERIGAAERLEAAVKICLHLTHSFEHAPMYGRLAQLCRRLGRPEEAEQYERRHLAEYRRRMHRPDFAETIQVAARRYLPIARLRTIAFPDAEGPAHPGPRERAIAGALAGDWEAARAGFEDADPIDLKYRAEVEALGASGPTDRAIELYARALREDPRDRYVVGWLLDVESAEHHRTIQGLFREAEIAGPAIEALQSEIEVVPADPAPWRRLATLFALQSRGAEQARQFEKRAAVLEEAARERSRAIGRTLSIGMYRFLGMVQGLVHEVWATREAAPGGRGGMLRREDILGSVTDEMRDNVRNIFLAVREYARAKFPHATSDILEYGYSYKVTKEDEPSGGTSAALPAAIAFLSLFIQRPVPQDTAFTGGIVTDAHDVLVLSPIGDVEHKVNAAYHRHLHMLVMPAANRPQIEQGTLVPRAIAGEIVRYRGNFDEVVKLVFGEDAFTS